MAKTCWVDVQGDAGYQDVIECANALAKVCDSCWSVVRFTWIFITFNYEIVLQLLKMGPEEVLIESTGVVGQRIKKVVKFMCHLIVFYLHQLESF